MKSMEYVLVTQVPSENKDSKSIFDVIRPPFVKIEADTEEELCRKFLLHTLGMFCKHHSEIGMGEDYKGMGEKFTELLEKYKKEHKL